MRLLPHSSPLLCRPESISFSPYEKPFFSPADSYDFLIICDLDDQNMLQSMARENMEDFKHNVGVDLMYLDPPFDSNATYNVGLLGESGGDRMRGQTAACSCWNGSR